MSRSYPLSYRNDRPLPITYEGRDYSEGKKISWKDGFPALWTLLKYRFVD